MCEQVATREVTEDNGEWGGAFGGGREGGGSRLEEGELHPESRGCGGGHCPPTTPSFRQQIIS